MPAGPRERARKRKPKRKQEDVEADDELVGEDERGEVREADEEVVVEGVGRQDVLDGVVLGQDAGIATEEQSLHDAGVEEMDGAVGGGEEREGEQPGAEGEGDEAEGQQGDPGGGGVVGRKVLR